MSDGYFSDLYLIHHYLLNSHNRLTHIADHVWSLEEVIALLR